jgi:hypothetical protein
LPVLATVTICVAELAPTNTLPNDSEGGVMLATGVAGGGAAVPIPDKFTACGLLGALLATEMLAERAPAADGVKVAVSVQLAPAATEPAAQVPVRAKSLALVPPSVMPLIVSAALPVLVSVTLCAALEVPTCTLPNAMVLLDKLTAGAGADAPVPLRLTLLGEPVALCAIAKLPLRAPVAPGLNVTLTVQLAFAATELQLFVCTKSAAFVPPTVTPLTVSAAVPELVTVTIIAALVLPTVTLPKPSVVVLRLMAGEGFAAEGFAM